MTCTLHTPKIQILSQVTLEDRPHSFQIKYSEGGQEYTLYIQVTILSS